MSTRGWENVAPKDLQRMHAAPQGAKPSKYRNVRVMVDGKNFDSKREAGEYLKLKARMLAGEISELECQFPFPLYAPVRGQHGDKIIIAVIAHYVADFTFKDAQGVRHIVDAKGKRTAMYSLKAKWLNLQDGLIIEEV